METKRRAVELRELGESSSEVARRLLVSQSSVQRI